MTTNLAAGAAKLFTPEMLSRIASALGISPSVVEKAVTAGIPGLLAAFTSLVSKPGGATKLADAVAQQPPGFLSDIARAGPAAQKDMIDSGFGTLSSLLGGGVTSSLTAALSRYSGIGESGAKALMGLLGPLAMTFLGQQQRSGGLDASGLAQLLQSQKSNITRALPSGFAKQLGDAGLTGWSTDTASMERRRAEVFGQSNWGWALPALGIIALAALAWYLLGRHPERTIATLPSTKVDAPMIAKHIRDFVLTTEEEKGWMGRPVFSSDDHKIGEIIEIKRGPDNKVTDVFFDAGSFLGVGATRYHITTDQIQEVKPDGLVVNLKETEIEALPRAVENAKQKSP